MNYVPAIGAPGSVMRRMQEHPALACDLLRSLKALVADAEEVARASYGTGDSEDTEAADREWQREDPKQYALVVQARAAIAAVEAA